MGQHWDLIFGWDAPYWYGFLPEPAQTPAQLASLTLECNTTGKTTEITPEPASTMEIVNHESIASAEPDFIETVTSTFLNLDFSLNGSIIPNLLMTSILVILTFILWSALLFIRWQKMKLHEEVELEMEEFHLARSPDENQFPPSPVDLMKKNNPTFVLTDSPHRVHFSDQEDKETKLRKRFKKFSYGPSSFDNSNNRDTNFEKHVDLHLEEPEFNPFNGVLNDEFSSVQRAIKFDDPDNIFDSTDEVDACQTGQTNQEAVPGFHAQYVGKYIPHRSLDVPSPGSFPILNREGDDNLVQDIQEAIDDTSGGLGDAGFNQQEGSLNLKNRFMCYFGLRCTSKGNQDPPKRIRYVKSWFTAQ